MGFLGKFGILFLIVISPVCSQKNKDPRIVNGEIVDIKDYPYMAFLKITFRSFGGSCGGSIISVEHVLTAAHCLLQKDSAQIFKKGSVRIGSSNALTGGYLYIFYPNDYIIHPKYNQETNDYDVALIHVPEKMKIKKPHIPRPIKLIAAGQNVPPGTALYVTGWGRTGKDTKGSDELRGTTVLSFSNKYCQKYLYNNKIQITKRMFCAGVDAGGRGTYKGDSGGPLVTKGVQVGIVSFNLGYLEPNRPAIRTNITDSSIRNWINRNSGV